MMDPDNHVSVDVEIIKQAATVVEELEADGHPPDYITIQQNDIGDKGEFNLCYELTGET
jgi:hypothetical protein